MALGGVCFSHINNVVCGRCLWRSNFMSVTAVSLSYELSSYILLVIL